MNKTLKYLIIAAIVAVAIVLWGRSGNNTDTLAPGSDDSTDLQNEAASVDVGDLDRDFQDIDTDINKL